MKLKTNIFYTLMVILGMAMTSCVDESLSIDNPASPKEGDTPYYVKFRLITNSDYSTRAEGNDWKDPSPGSGFQDGTHLDHRISKKAGNIAIFFDENDKYISWAKLYSVNEVSEKEQEEDEDGNKFTPNTPEPEATFSCRFNGFADRKPAKVMVVVNLNQDSEAYKNLTNFPGWDVEEVMKNVWKVDGTVHYNQSMGKPEYKGDPYEIGYYVEKGSNNDSYFTMANSTYVTGITANAISKGKIHCAMEIDEKNFFMGEKIVEEEVPGGDIEIQEDIEEKTEGLTPVTVYLERMLSKFEMQPFNFDPNFYMPVSAQALDVCEYKDGAFTYTEQKWALQILGWGMNGLETESYLFKNLPDLTDGEQNDWIRHTDWASNSEYNKRSFWALDPHYVKADAIYPWQFDFAKDTYDPENRSYYDHFHSYDNGDKHSGTDQFSLIYYPFMDFCPDYKGKKKTDFPAIDYKYSLSDQSQCIYTPENTFIPGMTVDRSRGSRAYELAGTHLLICARLLINQEGGYLPWEGHIYRNRVGVTYLDEVSMFEDFMNAINWKLEGQRYMYYRYYPWDDDEVSDFHKTYGYGSVVRAVTDGKYSLYYQDPDGKYYELTWERLKGLNENPKFRLWRDADAINADGKIIPWIMYNPVGDDDDSHFKPLDLLILKKEYSIEDSNVTILTPSIIDDDEFKSNEIINTNFNSLEEYLDKIRLSFQYSVKEDGKDKWKEFDDYSKENNNAKTRDKNDIQSLFYEIWGVADDYNHGLMYYVVPIHVLSKTGGYVKDPNAKLEDDANPDFVNDERLYYYYGVVRNNWYKFNIHSINEIGVPVSDPAKPIVPNFINKKDQIKVNMEIGFWHIEDQTVTIN
ncbi:MAG: fimbria major subunit [Muribaculaceae bacterium]|nr:fimbria major subunit [Muribaculaceae bacterium]